LTDRIRIEVVRSSAAARELLKGRWPQTRRKASELADYVQGLIQKVMLGGDRALIELTGKFDGAELSSSTLQVTSEEIEEAYEKVEEEEISAVEFAKSRVQTLERALLERIDFEYEYEGVRVRRRAVPIRSVGCYVPGGNAAYPSSLIMTAVPAKVARVPRVVVCTPPKSGGEINPLTLVAGDICGVDEIFRVGGAQAIAALAYGTETIRPVEKVVGPGNRYVLMAKMLISRDVPIDLPAGPTEIVILADESADPRIVALDMLSQAEHGVDVVLLLVTTSKGLANAVVKEFEKRGTSLPNTETVLQTSSRKGFVLLCENLNEAVAYINNFAPEHLQVMTRDARSIAEKITSAGLILIGKYTPASASDYCLGTNHVLPTNGYGHVFSGLSSLDFIKHLNIVECSRAGLSKVGRNVALFAKNEGLMNHALAVEGRFEVG